MSWLSPAQPGCSLPSRDSQPRTQAVQIAADLNAKAQPGDMVVYCPDQLGPAVDRLLNVPDVTELTYPRLMGPQRIDWVDYLSTIRDTSPQARALQIRNKLNPGSTLFLVWRNGYEGFGGSCGSLATWLEWYIPGGRPSALPTRPTTSTRTWSSSPADTTRGGKGPAWPEGPWTGQNGLSAPPPALTTSRLHPPRSKSVPVPIPSSPDNRPEPAAPVPGVAPACDGAGGVSASEAVPTVEGLGAGASSGAGQSDADNVVIIGAGPRA